MSGTPPNRIFAVALVLVSTVLLGLAIAKYTGLIDAGSGIEISGLPTIGGPFSLTDQNGRTVTDASYRGKVMVIYFGYTYCPDVCPTELAKVATALDQLGHDADEVVPIFITVDPERDTPEKLRDYVAQFYPRMVGLTGTADEIKQVTKAYRVYAAKAGDTSGQLYLMDHTSFLYLMDREGHYRAVARPDASPEQLAENIRKLLHS